MRGGMTGDLIGTPSEVSESARSSTPASSIGGGVGDLGYARSLSEADTRILVSLLIGQPRNPPCMDLS
jgi:hypothetical protein